MLRRVVIPGASNAAAICLTPEFFVAPDTSTRPSSGPFARTRKRVMSAIVRPGNSGPVNRARDGRFVRRYLPWYTGARCSTIAAIASRMSSERRQTACASASTTRPSATGTRPEASTARFAP